MSLIKTPRPLSSLVIKAMLLLTPLAGLSAAPAAPDFGPNVIIFDPTMDPAAIKSQCDTVFSKQERSEFGPERYAILFKPGNYSAKFNIGFYTQVYGLGKLPDDVTITGEVRSDARWNNGNATLNFWRGFENLAVAPTGKNNMWAVSQAAPLRRVHIKGQLWLFDNGWSSGGFLADSKIDADIIPGSQQQWFSRNTSWGEWKGGVWNMVFLGCTPNPAGTWPQKPFTVIDQTPLIAEKPFLMFDNSGEYSVFVPAARTDSRGPSWENGNPPGESISLSKFYVARSDRDTAATLNTALSEGKNLLITPGIYNLDAPLKITQPNTIVLGLGMATLSPVKGTMAMEVSDVSGVKIANVLFDAGATPSPILLQIGEPGSSKSHADNPIWIYDIFCRVGGGVVGVAENCVTINSSDVYGDHAWIWRADHGAGAGWEANKSLNGLIVNGNNVTYYGLFVEHFQKDQTLWNGENGRVYFYQCEIPYDPPTQDQWKHGEIKGWPGYKVADTVKKHEAWGMGIYCVFKQDNIFVENAVEAPNTPDVKFHHILTFRLGGAFENSGINSIVNGKGDPATKGANQQRMIDYP